MDLYWTEKLTENFIWTSCHFHYFFLIENLQNPFNFKFQFLTFLFEKILLIYIKPGTEWPR